MTTAGKVGLIGAIGGTVFGILLFWLGPGAAWSVLGLALLGWVISFGVWIVWRILTGELDATQVRTLVGAVTSDRTRGL